MEWVYDNQQKEKEIFNAYREWFILFKDVRIDHNQFPNKEEIMIISQFDVFVKNVEFASTTYECLYLS